MKKLMSILLITLMLAGAFCTASAKSRAISEFDKYFYLRDAVKGVKYAEYLLPYDTKDVVRRGGTIPKGLEVKLFAPPGVDGTAWYLTGTPDAEPGIYKFKLNYTENGTEKIAYCEIKIAEKDLTLKDAYGNIFYSSDTLTRLTPGGRLLWEISADTPLPDGLEVKETDIDHGRGIAFRGTTRQYGTYSIKVDFKTYGGDYDFTRTFTFKVTDLLMPDREDCYIRADEFRNIDTWTVLDNDGDGASWAIPVHEEGSEMMWYIDSVSGEKGADNILISPAFYRCADNVDIYWWIWGDKSTAYEVYYANEDTTDISKFTKIGEYTTDATGGYRCLETILGGTVEDKVMRIAFRHVTERADEKLQLHSFCAAGGIESKLLKFDVDAQVNKLLFVILRGYTYKVAGDIPQGFELKEMPDDENIQLTLVGKGEHMHSDTFTIKVRNEQGVLVQAAEYRVNIGNVLFGDATLDGKINTGDAVAILRHSAGMFTLTDDALYLSDMTHDGKVNTGDASVLLRMIAGI